MAQFSGYEKSLKQINDLMGDNLRDLTQSGLPGNVVRSAMNWTMDDSYQENSGGARGGLSDRDYRYFSSTPNLTPALPVFKESPIEQPTRRQNVCIDPGTSSQPDHLRDEQSERDRVALSDTCSYLEDVVTNLTQNMHLLDPDIRKRVKGMHAKLAEISDVKPEGIRRDSFSSVSPHDLRGATTSSPDRKVKFADPLHQSDGPYWGNSSGKAGAFPTQDAVWQALSRLDNRKVPQPEPFNTSSGQSFSCFLKLFQEYCDNNFKGSSSLWIAELGRLLEGDIKLAFDAYNAPGDSYESVKVKLLAWVANRKEHFEGDKKLRFSSATMQPGESTSIFGMRLEKLFRLAYPYRTADNSLTLRRKYLHSVPESFRIELQTALNLTKSLTAREMPWSQILFHACQFDANRTRGLPDLGASSVPQEQGNRAPRQEVWLAKPDSPQNQRPSRSFERTRPSPRARSGGSEPRGVTCHYCRMPGHIKRECRKLHNQCFVCGSPDHRIADCPERRTSPRYNQIERPRQPPPLSAEALPFDPTVSGSLTQAYSDLLDVGRTSQQENSRVPMH